MRAALCGCIALLLLAGTLTAQEHEAKSPASSASVTSEEAELVRLTDKWTAAINAKDRPTLETLMASDFVLRPWDGNWQIARSRWLDNLFHGIDIRAYSHSAIRAQVYGNVAAVSSKWYWRGERGTTEKKPFEEHGYVLDMWRRDGGQWRVVSRTSVILPGKEAPPAQ